MLRTTFSGGPAEIRNQVVICSQHRPMSCMDVVGFGLVLLVLLDFNGFYWFRFWISLDFLTHAQALLFGADFQTHAQMFINFLRRFLDSRPDFY